MKHSVLVAATGILAVCSASSAQTDPLIFEDYFGDFYIVQGGNMIQTIARNFHGYAEPFIADGFSIKTSPMNGGGTGYEYRLSDGAIINSYNVPSHGGSHDAGWDGNNTLWNSQNFCASGSMWTGDAGWQGMSNPWNYNSNGGSCSLGTAFDTRNNWVWTQDYGPGYMNAYDTSGNLQASFPIQYQGYGGLAYEPASGWLWSHDTYGTNETYAYDTSGNLMWSGFINGLPNGIFHTAEFAVGAIPAPGAGALLGIGGLMAARRRR
jgi:hypothetical protein